MAEPLLEVRCVSKAFGSVQALEEVSLEVNKGEILAIIGPNGAGKTTLFNVISRVFSPSSGDVLFCGQSIIQRPVHVVAALGIARTFQNLQVFGHMTALENVMVGCHVRSRAELLSAALRLPWAVAEEKRLRARGLELLAQVGLADHAEDLAGSLSVGRQRLLELARALGMEPLLVLLDEPAAAGLTTRETAKLSALVAELRRDLDLTVALIEHDMSLVMGVSDRVVVLDQGRKIADGTPSEVQKDARVIAAYLGEEE